MSNTLIELIADGKISQEVFEKLLVALDSARSPKMRDVKVDYDAISNSHLLDLIGATQGARLASMHMAFSEMDASFARNLQEAGMLNRNIAECWLLLARHQFYYRTGVMTDVQTMVQLYHHPRCVTIECERVQDDQIDTMIRILMGTQSKNLILTVNEMSDENAQRFIEQLQSEASPFELIKLQLGSMSMSIEPIDEEDLVQQFSTLMQSVRSDVADLSAASSSVASSLLQQSRTWLSGFNFTNPITGCMAVPATDDLLGDEPPLTPEAQKKEKIGKLA